MKRVVFQILFVLMLIVLLPVSYLFVRQAYELSDNEAMVQRVYEQQLETILFTINQNSENIIYSWINRIDIPIEQQGELMDNIVNRLLQNNTAIKQIVFFDTEKRANSAHFGNSGSTNVTVPDRNLLHRLNTFLEQNYQRIEGIKNSEFTDLVFLLRTSERACAGVIQIHTNTFIDQNLGSGIQQISQDKFHISVSDTTLIIADNEVELQTEHESGAQYSNMWYLPGYRAGISLQSATIEQLVRSRSQRDVYIFWILVTVVVVGLVFAVYTITREMKLAELKSEFVSNVSHEIRTPLALISMYAETLLLKRVKNEAKADEYLSVIVHETSRLTSIVNRILNFSKMEKKKRQYIFSDVYVNEIIDGVVANFQPHFKSKGVNCIVETGTDVPVIRADAEAVTEALINLVDNAVKYSSAQNPEITIKAINKSDTIVIEVEDNGIGIEPKHQKIIFDKFYRVTRGDLAHMAKGSGLGLNIVLQIMKSHGGKVLVKSEKNKGSIFSLVFKKSKQ